MCLCIYIYVCLYIHVCLYICVCIYIYIYNMVVYIYIYITDLFCERFVLSLMFLTKSSKWIILNDVQTRE